MLLGGALLALASTGLTPSVAAAPTSIYVVQGLLDRTVSVSVDGETVAEGLAGGKVAGPFPVERGTRTVTVSEDDKTVVSSKVTLAAGSSSEVVVHLPASPTGDPMVTRFGNNLQAVQPGRAAHSVAHLAAAGPIDVRVNKNVVSANLANGEYTYKVVPAGTRSVEIVPTGMSDPLLGPFDQTLAAGKMTWVFVFGVPGQDLRTVRHVIDLAASEGSEATGGCPHRYGRAGRQACREPVAGARAPESATRVSLLTGVSQPLGVTKVAVSGARATPAACTSPGVLDPARPGFATSVSREGPGTPVRSETPVANPDQ